MSVIITDAGVTVPDQYIDEDKVVIRTPFQVIDISSGFSDMVRDGTFPVIDANAYEEVLSEDNEKVDNPDLFPDKISFKAYGEEKETFEVTIQ